MLDDQSKILVIFSDHGKVQAIPTGHTTFRLELIFSHFLNTRVPPNDT